MCAVARLRQFTAKAQRTARKKGNVEERVLDWRFYNLFLFLSAPSRLCGELLFFRQGAARHNNGDVVAAFVAALVGAFAVAFVSFGGWFVVAA